MPRVLSYAVYIEVKTYNDGAGGKVFYAGQSF